MQCSLQAVWCEGSFRQLNIESKFNWLINSVRMIKLADKFYQYDLNTNIQVKVKFAKQYLVKVYFAKAL